jgi:peptide/nickel transport system substrate-binding protein
MLGRKKKFRIKRRMSNQKKQVELSYEFAEQHLDKHFFNRVHNLGQVRRFLSGWIAFLLIIVIGVIYQWRGLGAFYLSLQPVSGGTYSEGILGSFTNANPLYATTPVDTAVSKLLFSGLFTYDNNNKLVGDLADKIELDSTERIYTVNLKNNLLWQDGEPLTASDVVFTYQTIQNPDAKSPLFASWRGIQVLEKDPTTVTFTLPNSLSAFPYSLTNGIVPRHLLAPTTVSQLRSQQFNTDHPVGTGPFSWGSLEVTGDTVQTRQEKISLLANSAYHQGKPKIAQFVIRTFRKTDAMVASFSKGELSAMSGLDEVPASLKKSMTSVDYNIPLTSAVMLFLRTSQESLKDIKVRRAVALATDVKKLRSLLDYPVIAVDEPLLKGQIGYNPASEEQTGDLDQANKLLDEAGWIKGTDGIRAKAGKPLELNFVSQNSAEYTTLSKAIKEQWQAVGIKLVGTEDLKTSDEIQSVITERSYDVLLYGISIGADPDVFAYWHSTQADIRSQGQLNVSEYKSSVADQSLEAGRTRSDSLVRAIKYKAFLEAWKNDVPAIALYQPRFLYITSSDLVGLPNKSINSDTDRFNNVQDWTILKERRVKN